MLTKGKIINEKYVVEIPNAIVNSYSLKDSDSFRIVAKVLDSNIVFLNLLTQIKTSEK